MRTPLCDLLGIDVPVVQAGMSIFTSPALVVAVSGAGALGSLGAWRRSPAELRDDLARIRDATDRPFAVNHVVPELDREALEVTLADPPAVVSFALDAPGDVVRLVHDAGSRVMHQVTTVTQAYEAVEQEVDIVVAQGSESGGYGGVVSTMALVPQVVDAVAPVPVVAAGGIADGRGLAAALMLGASGVNVGTRFLAATEAPVGQRWKQAIIDHGSESWVKYDFLNVLSPVPGTVGYGTTVRGLRTEFVARWQAQLAELAADPSVAGSALEQSVEEGRMDELMVVGGQSANLVREVLPAAEIVRRFIEEAGAALAGR